MSVRRAELEQALGAVERRIGSACVAAGRDRDEVTLVVVTKFFPAADVRMLHELGVREVGESRHQEGAAKREKCAGLDLTWHFIGHLQSNKAASVAGWADVVQSVDRHRVLSGLARGAQERHRTLGVLVQVSLDPGDTRGDRSGCPPEEAPGLAEAVEATPGLECRGVMAVAPLGADPLEAFERLARTAAAVRAAVPSARWVSAGMSGDLEAAVAAGATHLRVGSAVLGNRPSPR